jgi:hypothetical protein
MCIDHDQENCEWRPSRRSGEIAPKSASESKSLVKVNQLTEAGKVILRLRLEERAEPRGKLSFFKR